MNGTESPIAESLRGMIAHQLRVDARLITREAQFIDQLGADSLAVVDLICAVEDRFDLDIPEEDLGEMRSFGDLLRYVELWAAKQEPERQSASSTAKTG